MLDFFLVSYGGVDVGFTLTLIIFLELRDRSRNMLNDNLAQLNFCKLLHYGGSPKVQNTYDPPLHCSGYCVACEESGNVFKNADEHFDQMSHGCDTSDFEELLGTLHEANNSFPVVFLLENPGGDYDNGDIVPYKGYEKQPPVNHYYWSPNIDEWPDDLEKLPNLYGPYFAYLMKKHGLKNVYITNAIKCNTIPANEKTYDKKESTRICVQKWLKKEIEIFSPKYIFCFGGNAYNYLRKYLPEYYHSSQCVNLYHPAARNSRTKIVSKNDKLISDAIKNA